MMKQLSTQNHSTNCVNTYKKQEIAMSSPEKCILYLYDIAIQSCALRERERAGRALSELIDALNFEAGSDIATRLFGLYEYCIRMVHEGKFEISQKILHGLRDAWHSALAKQLAA